jgi:hypothetical protein
MSLPYNHFLHARLFQLKGNYFFKGNPERRGQALLSLSRSDTSLLWWVVQTLTRPGETG